MFFQMAHRKIGYSAVLEGIGTDAGMVMQKDGLSWVALCDFPIVQQT
jgi:hypothetical protein